ncbi:MAG: hypothetical protein R2823_10905 [Acidimicrobiia bacterium]
MEPPSDAAPKQVPPPAGSTTPADEEVAAADTADAMPPPLVPIHDTGEFGMDEWTLPPEPTRSKAVWLLPIALLAAVAAFWGFVWFGGDSPTPTTVAAAPETTTTSSPSSTTTTTGATTTTSSSTTTTTVPYPAASDWEGNGNSIALTELPLKAAGIGELAFGTPIDEVAGTLVASIGTPDAAGDSDLCQPEEAYWLQWGPLRAVFDGWESDASFVSYRYEDRDEGTTDVVLRTLSGLEVGHTVEQLKSTYGSFTVTFEVIDAQNYFRLVDGGELLLWGPVTSTDDDGTVVGIYSPTPCP